MTVLTVETSSCTYPRAAAVAADTPRATRCRFSSTASASINAGCATGATPATSAASVYWRAAAAAPAELSALEPPAPSTRLAESAPAAAAPGSEAPTPAAAGTKVHGLANWGANMHRSQRAQTSSPPPPPPLPPPSPSPPAPPAPASAAAGKGCSGAGLGTRTRAVAAAEGLKWRSCKELSGGGGGRGGGRLSTAAPLATWATRAAAGDLPVVSPPTEARAAPGAVGGVMPARDGAGGGTMPTTSQARGGERRYASASAQECAQTTCVWGRGERWETVVPVCRLGFHACDFFHYLDVLLRAVGAVRGVLGVPHEHELGGAERRASPHLSRRRKEK